MPKHSTHATVLSKTSNSDATQPYEPINEAALNDKLSNMLFSSLKTIVDHTPNQLMEPHYLMHLIENGANPNIKYKSMSLIHVIVTQVNHFDNLKSQYDVKHKRACMDAIEKLVTMHHVDINERCDKGSALQMMLDNGYMFKHYDFVKLMLTLGADPNTTNQKGEHISDLLIGRWDEFKEFKKLYVTKSKDAPTPNKTDTNRDNDNMHWYPQCTDRKI